MFRMRLHLSSAKAFQENAITTYCSNSGILAPKLTPSRFGQAGCVARGVPLTLNFGISLKMVDMKMKIKISSISLIAMLLLCGCASKGQAGQALALSGHIVAKRQVSATNGHPGASYQAAFGAVAAAIRTVMDSAPSFYVYTVSYGADAVKDVNSFSDLSVGTCIDVLVPRDKQSVGYIWAPEEVVLKISSSCKDLAPAPALRVPGGVNG